MGLRGTKIAAAGVAALVALASAPATAHADGQARQRRGLERVAQVAPSGTTVFSADRHRRQLGSPLAAVRSAGDLRDPRHLVAAEAAAIRTATAGGAVDIAAAAAGTDAVDGVVRVGLPAGDLDADGAPDVMTFEVVDATGAVTLAGRGGRTGAVRWTRDYSDAVDVFVVPGSLHARSARDLNGDGAADPVIVALRLDSETLVGGCTGVFLVFECVLTDDAALHWDLSAVNGRTGASLWSQTYDVAVSDKFVLADAFVAFALADAVTITNALAVPSFVSDDITGDTRPDLTLGRYDVTAAFVAGGSLTFAKADVELVQSHLAVLSGADGSASHTRELGYLDGIGLLLPAGQAVGSARGDLLYEVIQDRQILLIACAVVCVIPSAEAVRVQMVDGETDAAAWTTSLDDPLLFDAFADGLLADLDGDGAADVVTFTTSQLHQTITGLSGATGATLWQRVDEDTIGPIPLGSIEGGPGTDVLWFTFAPDGSLLFERRDGAAGALLSATTHTFAPGEFPIAASVLPDATGDGVGEISLDVGTFGPLGATTATTVESGALGSLIATLSLSGVAISFPAGDLTGDGKADLAQEVFDGPNFRVATAALPGGAPVFSRSYSATDGFIDGFVLSAEGNATGLLHDDLIVSVLHVQFTPTFGVGSAVEVLESSGTPAWTVGAI